MTHTRSLTAAILTILLLFIPPAEVSAHAGDTDANGGHIDNSSGEYHYHHGYPAHTHYDMDGDGDIDCPYDFHDNTGSNSGGQSNGSKFSKTDPTPSSFVKSESTTVITKTVVPDWFAVLFVLVTATVFFLIIGIVIMKKIHKNEMLKVTSQKDAKINELTHELGLKDAECTHFQEQANMLSSRIVMINSKIDQEASTRAADIISHRDQTIRTLQARCDRKDREIQDLVGTINFLKPFFPQSESQARIHRSLQRYCSIHKIDIQIPSDITFINGTLPIKGRITDDRPFGDYTIYVADKGQVYHSRRYCGNTYSIRARHLFDIDYPIRPCKTCGQPMDTTIPAWYTEFQKAIPYLNGYMRKEE